MLIPFAQAITVFTVRDECVWYTGGQDFWLYCECGLEAC